MAGSKYISDIRIVAWLHFTQAASLCLGRFFKGRIAGLHVADAHMATHMPFVSVNNEEADTLQMNLLSLHRTYAISDGLLSDFEVQVLCVSEYLNVLKIRVTYVNYLSYHSFLGTLFLSITEILMYLFETQ